MCSWGLRPAKAPGLWAVGRPWALPVSPPSSPEPHSFSPGSVTLKPWSPGLSSSSSSDSVWPLGKPDSHLNRGLDHLNRCGSCPGGGGEGAGSESWSRVSRARWEGAAAKPLLCAAVGIVSLLDTGRSWVQTLSPVFSVRVTGHFAFLFPHQLTRTVSSPFCMCV